MSAGWLILDGYSLLHADAHLDQLRRTNFTLARQHLVRQIQGAVDQLADKTTVVFDGQAGGGPGEEFTFAGMDIRYSRRGQTADALIERLVSASSRAEDILVVSSDRMILTLASSTRAETMSCRQFIEFMDRPDASEPPRKSQRKPGSSSGPRLGDFFPDIP